MVGFLKWLLWIQKKMIENDACAWTDLSTKFTSFQPLVVYWFLFINGVLVIH